MATQYCYAEPPTLEKQLEEQELIINENRQRREEQLTLHLAQKNRDYEINRHIYRISMNKTRAIDFLMGMIYPLDPHNPQNPNNLENPRSFSQNINLKIYQPWMIEKMVTKYPLDLELLLADIDIFIKFEIKHYLMFWEEVKTRINLTTFVFPKKNTYVRTQYAAIQALPKIKSYWPS